MVTWPSDSHIHRHSHTLTLIPPPHTHHAQLEYKRRIWLTVEAPVDALFCDDLSAAPLWRRLVSSLPDGRI